MLTWIWRFVDQHGVHGENVRANEALHIVHNLYTNKTANISRAWKFCSYYCPDKCVDAGRV